MRDSVAAEHIGGVAEPAIVWRNLAMLIGHWSMRGYGFFSVEEKATGDWVGRVGPWNPHDWPEPEVGWAITRAHWGKGYAPEAASAAMAYVFDRLDWPAVHHAIAPDNVNSQAVARKLGSTHTGRQTELPGFGVTVDLWGQTRAQWAEARKSLGV